MTNPPKVIYVAIFLLFAFGFLLYERTHKIKVFVLHSYSKTMPWVSDLNKGIEIAFKNKNYIDVRYFYMDTKRKHSDAYLHRISIASRKAIHNYKPDILLAFDTYAESLVAQHFVDNDEMNVVVAGLTKNKAILKYKKAQNVTGVIEQIPVKAIREVLSLIFYKKRRLYIITDDSASAKKLNVYLHASMIAFKGCDCCFHCHVC